MATTIGNLPSHMNLENKLEVYLVPLFKGATGTHKLYGRGGELLLVDKEMESGMGTEEIFFHTFQSLKERLCKI